MLKFSGRNINFNGDSYTKTLNNEDVALMRINSNYYGNDLHVDFNIFNPALYRENKAIILTDIEAFLDGIIDSTLLTIQEENEEEENPEIINEDEEE